MSEKLPPQANLEHLKKQAKDLLRTYRAKDPEAVEQFKSLVLKRGAAPKLADAQRLIAKKYGFASWQKLKAHITTTSATQVDPLQLVKAAFDKDDAKALRELLSHHPHLSAFVNEPICPFDSPPINWVRSREMLDVLLEAGADINARSRWWAGGFGILDSIEPKLATYAIKHGATITAHAAARLGMIDELRRLISADPSLLGAPGGDGQTPLHFASTIEIAEYLLDNAADIDARDIDHESTPAQYMVKDRHEIARFLVSRGCQTDILMAAALGDLKLIRKHLDADPDSIRTTVSEKYFPKVNPRAGGSIYIWTLGHNKTPHQIAHDFGHNEVLQLLMERSPVALKLAQACFTGDDATVKSLRKGVRSISQDDRRKLVDAAQDNNTRAVKLMLEAGWPIDARGQHDGTALHWAAFHGNPEMIRELLCHNPPIDDDDNEHKSTPLGWAVYGSEHGWYCKTGDYPRAVDLLCAAGAKLPKEISGTAPVQEVLGRYKRKKKG